MKDLPIIFSAPMVRALLDGRKTQTRRILKPQPAQWQAMVIDITPPFFNEDEGGWGQVETIWSGPLVPGMCEPEREEWRPLRLPYAVGDRPWVREACALWMNPEGKAVLPPDEEGPAYRASMTEAGWRALRHDQGVMAEMACGASERSTGNWVVRSPIHMPRWASRITLEVTEVRVQRLNEISEEDARAEGVEAVTVAEVPRQAAWSYREDFASLWRAIHGPDAWAANPWCCCITFKRVK